MQIVTILIQKEKAHDIDNVDLFLSGQKFSFCVAEIAEKCALEGKNDRKKQRRSPARTLNQADLSPATVGKYLGLQKLRTED